MQTVTMHSAHEFKIPTAFLLITVRSESCTESMVASCATMSLGTYTQVSTDSDLNTRFKSKVPIKFGRRYAKWNLFIFIYLLILRAHGPMTFNKKNVSNTQTLFSTELLLLHTTCVVHS